jgi:hypothetical protein
LIVREFYKYQKGGVYASNPALSGKSGSMEQNMIFGTFFLNSESSFLLDENGNALKAG